MVTSWATAATGAASIATTAAAPSRRHLLMIFDMGVSLRNGESLIAIGGEWARLEGLSARRRSGHDAAAVDLDDLTGDVAGKALAREEEEGAGALVGRAEAAHRNSGGQLLQQSRRSVHLVDRRVD